ncbi:MAG: T9SS type A sorting domain-containing protein [Hymenobacteraceae bacterium]|nr:T9SS type A sorting domain-containing protein [Hymenobacteraceae bacterium]MDX5396191.1 T9SS type A sorting domain-containing protein [Hymenobacteraceae bacterium]MDX5444188.1 T9SS type A sorting domain-containing protein [Hymenobacteraceae bacterium]MDX5512253.1 T9SS type A sorting domain-containing protein [Hymenobacteraceae bacterium]
MRKLYVMMALLLGVHYANGQCTNPISVTPTSSYTENFNSGAGQWTSGGTANTWVLGNTSVFSRKAVINTPAGGTGNAWVTSDTAATSPTSTRNKYKNSENSFVQSPCFNFSGISNPVIRFKIWWATERPADGAALQYSTNGGTTWQSVGALNDPDNWYNTNVTSKPGGQNAGWSGNSGGYVVAQHDLNGTGNQAQVLLRFVFRSDFLTNADGIAFDDIEIFDKPAVDLGVTGFTAPVAGCGRTANENVSITIKNFGAAPQSNIPVSYSFTGAGTGSGTAVIPGPIAPGATVTFTFPQGADLRAGGTYTFSATVNQTGDNQTSNNTFANFDITNVTAISTFPYTENFENTATATDWTSGGTNSSWAKGTPIKAVINGAASGSNAWVTGRTGTHNANERSFVESRCFDFSNLLLPVFEFKIWWDSDVEDGAVLQSSIDDGATWQVVGAFNDPNNWYNDNTILGTPGGQATGWSGRMATNPPRGSGGWVLAKHDLPTLAGRPSVKFRVAFGSNASTNYDGFAFDDVTIYDKPENDLQLTAILEPFSGCGLSNQERVVVQIRNVGARTQRNFPVSYSYTRQGGATVGPITQQFTDSIQPGQSKFFFFSASNWADLSQQGTYNFTSWIALNNDTNRSNDTIRNYEVSNIQVRPTPSAPYIQNFEANKGGWFEGGANRTWAFGTPNKSTIRGAASGSNAWVTGGLGTGTYNANEFSYVESPCMDFSQLSSPVVEMKVWWSSEFNQDGAALQVSTNGGQSWITVGRMGDPNNWYNSNNLSGNPGGQKQGWSGTGQNSSGGWIVVQHNLDTVRLKPFVIMRVAFGSNASNQEDGFAFDDVVIFQKPTSDVGVVSIVPIAQSCGFSNCETISAVVKNNGSAPVANVPVSYQVGNNPVVTQTFADTIPAGGTLQVNFSQCADLSAIGSYQIRIRTNLANDQLGFNNELTATFQNALFNSLPLSWTFEPNSQNSFGELRTVSKAQSNIYVSPAAGNNSAGGMIMDGGATGAPWVDPIPPTLNPPFVRNPDHFAAAYICVDASKASRPELSFDLKQVVKGLFSNVNFRVTINGVQIGQTYQPPVNSTGTNWQRISVDLTPYKNLGVVRIGLESSVRESYRGGAGHANMIDSIVVRDLVGIQEDLFAKSINVYPNPTNGIFNIAVGADNNQAYTVEVTDLSGRTVKTARISNGARETVLVMTAHAKGVYLLKVMSEGNIATKKLVLY